MRPNLRLVWVVCIIYGCTWHQMRAWARSHAWLYVYVHRTTCVCVCGCGLSANVGLLIQVKLGKTAQSFRKYSPNTKLSVCMRATHKLLVHFILRVFMERRNAWTVFLTYCSPIISIKLNDHTKNELLKNSPMFQRHANDLSRVSGNFHLQLNMIDSTRIVHQQKKRLKLYFWHSVLQPGILGSQMILIAIHQSFVHVHIEFNKMRSSIHMGWKFISWQPQQHRIRKRTQQKTIEFCVKCVCQKLQIMLVESNKNNFNWFRLIGYACKHKHTHP